MTGGTSSRRKGEARWQYIGNFDGVRILTVTARRRRLGTILDARGCKGRIVAVLIDQNGDITNHILGSFATVKAAATALEATA